MNATSGHQASRFEHEEVVVRRGQRSGLPIIVAIHSTARGPAIGGCRFWQYPHWTDGLTDALRLSAGMTDKCAAAGIRQGGGKTVVALPPGQVLDPAARRDILHDVGDAIDNLGGRYTTGPDVGTTPDDMATIGERTTSVFCRPRELGGSGDSSPRTATGVLAALQALCAHLDGRATLDGRRISLVGLGHVGTLLARELAAAGAKLLIADIDTTRRVVAAELGAEWTSPEHALTAEVDVLIPAALGGQLTDDLVPRLRCAAIAGPANNQLANESVADLLHSRGITWAPDYLVSAGGILYATASEIDRLGHDQAVERVRTIGANLTAVLDAARHGNCSPHHAARARIHALLQVRNKPEPAN
ncbi:Glu/Leu/Phe/Val dehydrogenase family protein [Saccharopolyspora sp. K220]|uniref:Glu/Leu/Phe/Val dehydrogenase dimerization domain-containing protein n=1 Tax=Saccharopolyspora soli TaxID=2926618 RepID=UPI001F560DEB|nr:Glu/Leu/Phe/Val dehydrogenase dimerization domain-containing protein [Saccharopolyspora soli]MCI2420586.1 Glu/Leu/Phe/Val dehydrogenase family protein [Saccharopolyspora soli]